jgi:hypothetical protein
MFPIQDGLKQGGAQKPILFNFALEYAIRKVQETQVGVKLRGISRSTDKSYVYVDATRIRSNIVTQTT